MDRCNEVWKACGLPEMTGHSFRIGGATYLLLLGTHPDVVAMQGGWESRAFLDYWRRIESILPLFIAFGDSLDTRIQAIRASFDNFRTSHNL